MDIDIRRLWDGSPAEPGEAARVRLRRRGDGIDVEVHAPFHGDPPPAAPAGRLHRLWEYEVVELFLVGEDDRYLELELGPHGHYLALRLEGVRRPTREILLLDYHATIDGDRWHGRASFDRAWLPPGCDRWNGFAVHGVGPSRRFLAAHPLPGDEVDFHQPGRFPTGAAAVLG